MEVFNNIKTAIDVYGGFDRLLIAAWPNILRLIVFAAFIGFLSGKPGRIFRRVAVSSATVFVLFASYLIFTHGIRSIYLEELRSLSSIVILFLSSLACGEKSPFYAASFSLIAVNVTGAADSVMTGLHVFQSTSKIIEMKVNVTNTQYGIALAAATLILAAAAVFFRKTRADLSRGEKIAIMMPLVVITAVIMFIRRIVYTNLQYFLTKIITIYSTKQTVIFSVLTLGAMLLINAAVYVLFVVMAVRQKERAEQAILTQKYLGQSAIIEEVSKQHEKVSKMRHDLLNTLGTVDGLIAAGRDEEAREFIRSHTGVLFADVRTVNTDNEYVNAIISYKTAQAKEKGVDVSVYAESKIVFPDNADLCNLIGNMLDNGINAAEKCEKEKDVRLDITRDGASYRVSVLNSVTSPVLESNPDLVTVNPDKLSHGYGMKIIKEIAEKYYGSTDWYDTDDGRFCCSAVLYPARPF